MIKDVILFGRIGKVISHNAHAGYSGVARKLRETDDLVRRTIAKFESHFGQKLVDSKNGRLCLTKLGAKVCRWALEVDNLVNGADGVEALTIETDDFLGAYLLPVAFTEFLATWPDQVAVRFIALDSARVRTNIASGLTSFGLGFGGGNETLEASMPWYLVGSKEWFTGESVCADLLSNRTLFVPTEPPPDEKGIESTCLRHIPASRRVECGSINLALQMAGKNGLAVVPGFGVTEGEFGGMTAVPLPEIQPVQISLYLPKNLEEMSDAARMLLDAIRSNAVQRLTSPRVEEPILQDAEQMDALETEEVLG